jgi:hypothetical protein
MKAKPTLKLIISCLFVSFAMCQMSEAAEKSVQQVFEEGKVLLYGGQTAAAAEKFKEVLKRDPRHAPAQFYLAKAKPIETKERGNVLEVKMTQVMVPKIEFSDAPLGEVIEYVGQKTEQLTGGAFRPNIVYKGPREDLTARKVTLKLSGIPMSELLRYVGEVTNTHFKYGQYAIEGVPASEMAAELKAQAEAMAAKQKKEEAEERATSKSSDPFAPKTDDDPFKSYLK